MQLHIPKSVTSSGPYYLYLTQIPFSYIVLNQPKELYFLISFIFFSASARLSPSGIRAIQAGDQKEWEVRRCGQGALDRAGSPGTRPSPERVDRGALPWPPPFLMWRMSPPS